MPLNLNIAQRVYFTANKVGHETTAKKIKQTAKVFILPNFTTSLAPWQLKI
ncbi:uncharacterized protein METZ01_LOCUS388148 [marine metagenome]|uniref:Uncharacterized protein n=1 Tax=marine metagenome TaxID=408172 RepID=A0A382UM03_9ZZZZ